MKLVSFVMFNGETRMAVNPQSVHAVVDHEEGCMVVLDAGATHVKDSYLEAVKKLTQDL